MATMPTSTAGSSTTGSTTVTTGRATTAKIQTTTTASSVFAPLERLVQKFTFNQNISATSVLSTNTYTEYNLIP